MFLEFSTPSGIAHCYEKTNLKAGLHHVHALEEHSHAASFPNKGPVPWLSITEGPAQLTRPCQNRGIPQGTPSSW